MKLLNKSIRQLAQYALIIFLICVPLFYFIIEQLYIQDVDDALFLKRDELRVRVSHLHTQQDIDLWLAMDDDVRIAPLSRTAAGDSIYFTQYPLPHEIEPYRELVSSVTIENRPYRLIVRASLLESRDLIIGIAEAQAVLLLLLLAGWVLIIRFRSRKTWRPFYSTIAQLRQYELDGGHLPNFERSAIREFDDLNKAITELVSRNHRVYLSQKAFIENASHEMQTPLAIFRSKLDNMIEGRSLTTRESEDFEVLYEAVQRLHQLNKGLLLLSRIGNNQFPESGDLSVAMLLHNSVSFLQDMIESKGIRLQLEPAQDVRMQGSETLVQIMITNLLTNAIQHNQPNGTVAIHLADARLTIVNSGHPLPFRSEDLFARFKKHASPQKGLGLGLAIVKEIADKYALRVHYEYSDPLHSFSIHFQSSKTIV